MRKLKIYKNGKRYFDGGQAGIFPTDVEPVAEYDLSGLSEKEYQELLRNPKDKKLIKKAKKIRRKHGA